MRVPASLSTVSPYPMPISRRRVVAMAQKVPPPKKATPKVAPKRPLARRKSSVWGPTEEPVIRWWNDSMQSNLEKNGPMRLVGRAQWASSPLAMLVLGPIEALLVILRQQGPRKER